MKATSINIDVLIWARERAGFSREDFAIATGYELEKIKRWECGEDFPTYVQLEKIAYTYLHIPVAVFFFPEPPREESIEDNFRTVPNINIGRFEPNTLQLLRYAKARQLDLYELSQGENRPDKLIFKELKLSKETNINKFTYIVRDYINYPIEQQRKANSVYEAINLWREKLANVGIFVFRAPFKQEGISGFCLLDEEFPVIYINSSEAIVRQIFTICHELAHILIGENGVTISNNEYIEHLNPELRSIEILCNKFAGSILLPREELKELIKSKNYKIFSNTIISDIAHLYCISQDVVIRRLYDTKYITKQNYKSLIDNIERKGRTGTGGNYYKNTASYLGYEYIKLVFNSYYKGQISIEQVSEYLNVKTRNLPGIEVLLEGR